MLEFLSAAAGLASGMAIGYCVTKRIYDNGGFWSKQIGKTRFRRANIPVGFVVFTILSAFVPYGPIALVVIWAAAGMGVTAVSYGHK